MTSAVHCARIVSAVLSGLLVVGFAACNQPSDRPETVREKISSAADSSSAVVTPVSGPSWLKHLGISDDMGRLGGSAPTAPSAREEPSLTGQVQSEQGTGGMGGMGGMMRRIYPAIRANTDSLLSLMNEPFELTGSDLYRLNCQSCHGPTGEGSPPEVKSLIGPVQGTSASFLMERMKKLGRTISPAMARDLTQSADSTLRQRLQHGGEQMPPFPHLRGDEIDALLQYLQKLAGVAPPGQKPMVVPQSVARVGEHLVKGTCHTCHDATGPGGGRMAMMSGVIPSLASMTQEQSLQAVVRQVREGSSPMMSMMGGPEMPAYPYITEDEAAAAYLYLLEYPPVAAQQ